MAQVVLGIGSSHGPTIQTPAADWPRLGAGDARDPRYNYEELLKAAKPGIEKELDPALQQQRHEANQAALAKLKQIVQDANLDAIVTVSNPHRTWPDDNQPVFGIFRGATLPVAKRTANRYDPDAR